MEKINVMRMCLETVCNIQLGDKIPVPLAGFGEFTATAHKITDKGVLFIFDDPVAKHQMNKKNTNEGGFEKSDLKKWLDTVLLEAFPDWLKGRIESLSIPAVGELFGHEDEWDNKHFESDTDEQLPLMKERRNRVAYFDNDLSWIWLRNAVKKEVSAAHFALVDNYGDAVYDGASYSYGVRPEFWCSSSNDSVESLKEEIKSKTKKIALLHSKIKKLETTEIGKKAGEEIKAAMDGYVSAGFTEDQAFQLVIVSILSHILGR